MRTTATVQLSPARIRSLEGEFKKSGAHFKSPPPNHTHYQAKLPGVSVTAYTSGKVVIQGKGTDDFLASYGLSPHPTNQTSSRPAPDVPYPHIGSDESGKGDYFGPLVVAAMYVREEDIPVLEELGVRDSKALKDGTALRLAKDIEAFGRHAIVTINPARYNELRTKMTNVNHLLGWAHARALENVLADHPCEHALADKFGDEGYIHRALMAKGRDVKLHQETKAEADIAVAAASILARAGFLRGLARLSRKWDISFPKGASAPVIAAGKQFVARHGATELYEVAKVHFATTKKVKGSS